MINRFQTLLSINLLAFNFNLCRYTQRWQAIAPWLEADPTSAAELPAPPLPHGVDPAAAGKAQSLVLPTVVSNAVIKLSAIRVQLERSGRD